MLLVQQTIDDGPGTPPASSDPGGGMPSTPATDHRVNVSGGRPVRVPAEPLGPMGICKRSFIFKKVISIDKDGFGGWQVAAVAGIHMTLLDSKGEAMLIIPAATLYFGLPVIRKNGEFYSTDKAAEIAVAIDNAAIQILMNYYHSGVPVDFLGLNAQYRKALNTAAEKYGGKVTLDPGIGNELPPLPANIVSYFDCN